jgi:hypothetical protein
VSEQAGYRILCIGETWFGSDARSAFSALRRLGHSTYVLDEAHYVPTEWRGFETRVLRKLFRSAMASELTSASRKLVDFLRPDALFVFKGNYVAPEVVDHARKLGSVALNYYPDVSFQVHGPQLPQTLPRYDHVFNAKTFGVADMQAHGIRSVSFLAPGFDPEVHRPLALTDEDAARYGCDVAFIGTWSPKKEALLEALVMAAPQLKVRIWGNEWTHRKSKALDASVMGLGITGDDYTRAICAAKVSLGLLSERREGASSGDLITARTFQIPACGAFMLHERNSEATTYFEEDREAGFFESPTELVEKTVRYVADDTRRREVAAAGRARSLASDYSIDARMRSVVDWIGAAKQKSKAHA